MAIGVTFSNRLGAQRVKSSQGTIKILMKSDFSSNLTPFLPLLGGGGLSPRLGGISPRLGEAQAFPKTYKVAPLVMAH